MEGTDFRVYDGEGGARSFADVVAAIADAEAVLVGETHDDAVGHGVETQILVRGAQRVGAVSQGGGPSRTVILSLEMFERDVQYVLDEYLAGLITEDQFKRSARPWDRYDTDYRPMVEFARAHEHPRRGGERAPAVREPRQPAGVGLPLRVVLGGPGVPPTACPIPDLPRSTPSSGTPSWGR